MIAIALTLCTLAQPPQAEPPKVWGDPSAAYQAAIADATALGPNAWFCRYVWMPYADEQLYKWHLYTANECVSDLHNGHIVRPTVLAGGTLLRWDLRHLAPQIRADGTPDVFRLMAVWDSIFDPHLSVQLVSPIKIKIATAPYKANDGKTYSFRIVDRSTTTSELFEPYGSQLQALTLTNTPMITLHELQRRMLTTVDGGKYYDLLGLPSTVNELLAKFGAERNRAEQFRSDLKAVQLVSGVTHGPRRIVILPGQGSRPSENQSLAFLTEDFVLDTVAAGNDPARNLAGTVHDAGEIIIERPNGGHVYYLADGQGKRQDLAPDKIPVHDPNFIDKRLQPAKSCIVCHAQEQSRGLISFQQQAVDSLGHSFDAVERGAVEGVQIADPARLVGQYRWNADKLVSRCRDDYSDFAIATTGNLQPEDLGELTRQFFVGYWETPVDAREALCVLGQEPPATVREASAQLRQILPPLNVEVVPGLLPEDPYIAALLKGQQITRQNFLQVNIEMRRRVTLPKEN